MCRWYSYIKRLKTAVIDVNLPKCPMPLYARCSYCRLRFRFRRNCTYAERMSHAIRTTRLSRNVFGQPVNIMTIVTSSAGKRTGRFFFLIFVVSERNVYGFRYLLNIFFFFYSFFGRSVLNICRTKSYSDHFEKYCERRETNGFYCTQCRRIRF